MTTLREAATHALEALESAVEYDYHGTPLTETHAGFNDAATALRAALAEPVQEQPVCDECGKHKQDGWALYCVGCVEPMFAPPQRNPLSDADLAKIWDDALDQLDPRDQLRFIARTIERAHGIT